VPESAKAVAAGAVEVFNREFEAGKTGTAAVASSPIAFLFTVREGRVAEARTFLSEQDALKAAGT
jgi:ketosteroid isomerase-like protein